MADITNESNDQAKQDVLDKFKALKSRIDNVTSRSELDTLMGEALNIVAKAFELGLDLKIMELLDATESKVTSHEIQVIQGQNNEDYKSWEEKQKLEEQKSDKIYDDFNKFHEEYLKEKEARSKALEGVLESVLSNKPITEEQKKLLLLTKEKEEEAIKREQQIALAAKRAVIEKDHHTAEIKKLTSQLNNITDTTQKEILQKKIDS